MKNWAKKHILLSKIRGKRRKKDRSRPLKDKKGYFKFRPSFKVHIKKRTPQHHCIWFVEKKKLRLKLPDKIHSNLKIKHISESRWGVWQMVCSYNGQLALSAAPRDKVRNRKLAPFLVRLYRRWLNLGENSKWIALYFSTEKCVESYK
jgi:hypothetical protein